MKFYDSAYDYFFSDKKGNRMICNSYVAADTIEDIVKSSPEPVVFVSKQDIPTEIKSIEDWLRKSNLGDIHLSSVKEDIEKEGLTILDSPMIFLKITPRYIQEEDNYDID